jgi:hypothetical protein
VNVFIYSVEPLRFEVEPVSNGLPKGPDGEIKFENKKHDGFNVYFDLKDPPENYVFLGGSHLSEAVWSQLGKQCPTSAASAVFTPKRVENNGKTLVVYNKNPSPAQGRFTYTLRVTNDGGKTYLPLDPGGDNMNGPTNFESAWSYVAVGVGSAFATAAVFAVAVSLAGFDLICPARF